MDLVNSLNKMKKKFLVVDFNPETIMNLSKRGIPVEFGDADDIEFLNQFDFRQTKLIISTVSDVEANLLLLNKVREVNKNAIVLLVAQQIDDSLRLYESGATYVIMPYMIGGSHVASMLENYEFDVNKFLKEKIKQMDRIKSRTSRK